MGSEQEVTKKIEQYRELAEGNKNIDVASLMINALEQTRQEETAAKKRRWAYLISVGLPPLGLLVAVRYYFSDKPDGKRIALMCVIFTAIAALIAWGIGALMMNGLGGSTGQAGQLPSVNAEDVRSLFQ